MKYSFWPISMKFWRFILLLHVNISHVTSHKTNCLVDRQTASISTYTPIRPVFTTFGTGQRDYCNRSIIAHCCVLYFDIYQMGGKWTSHLEATQFLPCWGHLSNSGSDWCKVRNKVHILYQQKSHFSGVTYSLNMLVLDQTW